MTDKTFVVFAREYVTRVKSKAFIVSTILAPLAMLALVGTCALLSGCNPNVYAGVDIGGPWVDLGPVSMGGSIHIGGRL